MPCSEKQYKANQGKAWIYKDNTNKMIYKKDLEQFLKDG